MNCGTLEECLNCPYPDCINDYIRIRTMTEHDKQVAREYQKKKRDEARVNGMCMRCFKNKATHGTRCDKCWLECKKEDKKRYRRKREEQNKESRETWQYNGKCYFCGQEVIEGKKVCKKHYEILMVSVSRCQQHENTKEARKKNNFKFAKRCRR